MRIAFLVVAGALTTVGIVPARAAVTESQFPPQTVRDLIAICGPALDDPLRTAAINFCQGYVQGAVIVEEAHASQRGGRKLFCLPDPRPPAGSELTRFVAWANEQPSRLDQGAVDGMFLYLAQKYPCGRSK